LKYTSKFHNKVQLLTVIEQYELIKNFINFYYRIPKEIDYQFMIISGVIMVYTVGSTITKF